MRDLTEPIQSTNQLIFFKLTYYLTVVKQKHTFLKLTYTRRFTCLLVQLNGTKGYIASGQ